MGTEVNRGVEPTPLAVPSAKKANLGEVGNSGINTWGGQIYEEFLPNLRWPQAGRVFQEMRYNDPVIGAIFYMAEQLVRKSPWEVVAGGETTEDLAAAEFLRSCMDDMSTSWTELIQEVLSYFTYGWSWHEIVYKKREGDQKDPSRNSRYDDGRIGWRKIAGRSQHSLYEWKFDDFEDQLVGMSQLGIRDNQTRIIPLEKSLLFRTTAERGNPEGRSLLRNAYRPWYFKKHIEEIEGIGIERDLAGLPVLTTPENVDIWNPDDTLARQTKLAAQNVVRNIRRDRNEGIVLPFGWNLELLASASHRQFDTNATINRYDQRIAITMLADIVMLGADKVGSFALADVKKGLLGAALEAQVENIATVFNRYAIPRLFALNTFTGMTKYPKIKPSEIETPSLEELGNYISKLSGSGMPLFPNLDLENHLRRVAGLPLTTQDDPARSKGPTSEETATPKSPNTNGTEESPEQSAKARATKLSVQDREVIHRGY